MGTANLRSRLDRSLDQERLGRFSIPSMSGHPEYGAASVTHGRRDWSEPGRGSPGSHGAPHPAFLDALTSTPAVRGYAPSARRKAALGLEWRSPPITNGTNRGPTQLPARALSAPSWAQRILEGMAGAGKKPSDVGCGCGCNGAHGGCERSEQKPPSNVSLPTGRPSTFPPGPGSGPDSLGAVPLPDEVCVWTQVPNPDWFLCAQNARTNGDDCACYYDTCPSCSSEPLGSCTPYHACKCALEGGCNAMDTAACAACLGSTCPLTVSKQVCTKRGPLSTCPPITACKGGLAACRATGLDEKCCQGDYNACVGCSCTDASGVIIGGHDPIDPEDPFKPICWARCRRPVPI
jgi:hypothetical protein